MRIPGSVNVYGSNGIVGSHSHSLTNGRTIIIGRKGSIGEILFSEESCWPIDTTYYIDKTFTNCDLDWLSLLLKYLRLEKLNKASGVPGLNREDAYKKIVQVPNSNSDQQKLAFQIQIQLAEVEKAKKATEQQILEIENLANAIIYESINTANSKTNSLGDVLDEVKKGVGKTWKEYLVLGATRKGLALAKEPPGKQAERYKPIFPGTVFYNPMRILIGSIAFVDENDSPGITSPDYVALKGKQGVVDSRWFYYWLRSQHGKTCINSLARGAVRERILFNRLVDGEIELPELKVQQKASEALKEIKAMRTSFESRLKELELLPNKLLIETFGKIGLN